ncbi:hypothetical protein Bca101_036748 [Brassica carinata]
MILRSFLSNHPNSQSQTTDLQPVKQSGETAPPQRRHRQLPPTPQHHHNHEPNHKTRHTPATRAKPASEQNGKSITPKTSKVRTLCFRDTKEEKTIPLQPATHLPPTKQYDTETGAEDEKNHHLHALLSL